MMSPFIDGFTSCKHILNYIKLTVAQFSSTHTRLVQNIWESIIKQMKLHKDSFAHVHAI